MTSYRSSFGYYAEWGSVELVEDKRLTTVNFRLWEHYMLERVKLAIKPVSSFICGVTPAEVEEPARSGDDARGALRDQPAAEASSMHGSSGPSHTSPRRTGTGRLIHGQSTRSRPPCRRQHVMSYEQASGSRLFNWRQDLQAWHIAVRVVISQSQTMSISVEVLHTGTVIVDEALPFHRPTDRPMAWTHALRSKRHLIEAPVSCYLISTDHGLILLDTGWHPINRTRWGQIKNLLHQYPVNKAILPQGQAINEQLEERGIRVGDLDMVLMSHLHCDHADGLRLVREAPRIMVSAPELRAAEQDRLRYLPHEWAGVDMQAFSWNGRLGPARRSFDVYGDGTVTMISTPGHSWGLCATLIRKERTIAGDFPDDCPLGSDPREAILLISDVGYGQPSLKEGLRPSVVVNAEDAEKSLAWVRSAMNDPRVTHVIANHDPTINPGLL